MTYNELFKVLKEMSKFPDRMAENVVFIDTDGRVTKVSHVEWNDGSIKRSKHSTAAPFQLLLMEI